MSDKASGRCLCGAVQYTVAGRLRDVTECHCAMCRRHHGHIGAYAGAAKTSLTVREDGALKWYRSSDKARRGFCGVCGSTLFWDPMQKDYIAIAAGTLDPPTGLKTVLQIHVADAGDYYTIRPDVPQRPGGSGG